MKLRTRLFLWVGIIFFITFAVSLVLEITITATKLQASEEVLRKKILELNEKKREHTGDYLQMNLTKDQAEIDSLLFRLARDPKFGATLFLTPENLQLDAPAHTAFLFTNDKDFDFFQTTKDGKLTSLLIPIDFPMDTVHQIPIDDELSWIVLEKDQGIDRPFMGVKLTAWQKGQSLSLLMDELIDTQWGLTAFFDPQALVNFTPNTDLDLSKESLAHAINMPIFLNVVEKASTYLKTNREKVGTQQFREWIKSEIEKKRGEEVSAAPLPDEGIKCLSQDGDIFNNKVIELLQRQDQAIMISTLSSLFPGGHFGDSLFAKAAPKGVARFNPKNNRGHGILTDEVFYKSALFDDSKYFHDHPDSDECKSLGSSIAVIAPKDLKRVFVGNSLKLQDPSNPQNTGFLTVGLDADVLVQDLVLVNHQDAFLVHNNQVISAYTRDGVAISDPNQNIPFNEKMLGTRSGIVNWKGERYYYLEMTPFQDVDLHFFVLEPEKKAFALVNMLKKETRSVIEKLSLNMRIIAVIALFLVMLLLHKVAKRITKPITALAKVTENVAAGKLEDIEIPKVSKGRHDEITTLCNSFEQMVTGLKEKEKVKGILNKVVSPEIAAEITKGTIHLGGEEKKVTVLFADIRSFTHMTSQMPPNEIVGLLNACMTKVSHEIDEFGGVIDKYVGDEVMALFGAPLEKEDSALKSILCALKMIEVLKEWNVERAKTGLEPVEMGFGIHTGIVLIGNMGAENRLNYTVIGSSVNLASRLCSIAGKMQILITKETLQQPHVAESIEVKELPPHELKGFEEAYTLYEVIGAKHV